MEFSWFVCGVCLLYSLFLFDRHRRSTRRADRIAAGLDNLLLSSRALITISNGIDGPVIGVIDDWTGFSEQSFVDVTIEDAIGEAIRFRDRKRKP